MLQADEKVQVTAEAGEWRWVKTEDGREGFVSASVLEELRRPKVVVKPQCIFAEDFVPWPKLQVLLEKYDYNLKREHLGIASDTSGYEEHEEDDEFTIAMYKQFGLRIERCWVKVENVPNCHVFLGSLNHANNSPLHRRPRLTWSGKCTDGVVSGKGAVNVRKGTSAPLERWFGSILYEPGAGFKVFFVQGKRHEDVLLVREGTILREERGRFVMGERQGLWVRSERQEYDVMDEYLVNYVDGRRHGDCTYRMTAYFCKLPCAVSTKVYKDTYRRNELVGGDGHCRGVW